jgi:uncharacterized protein (DUF1330 family)
MSVFVIGRMQIHSRDWMDEYFSKVPSLIESHAGRFLVRGGNPEKLEGEDVLPDAIFAIEFPDRKHALSFLYSEEFQPLITLRQSGSTLNAIMVDRLN